MVLAMTGAVAGTYKFRRLDGAKNPSMRVWFAAKVLSRFVAKIGVQAFSAPTVSLTCKHPLMLLVISSAPAPYI
jgi:hypothetical protein